MKTFAFICGVVACIIPQLVVAAPDGFALKSSNGWFDFEDCPFCRTLSENPALLAHITWENLPIKNGMMNIMTVDPAYTAALARAEEQMQALSRKIQAGEIDPAGLSKCGHCENFTALLADGVDVEEARGETAVVTLFTASDPQLIARLHEQAKRDTREMERLGGLGHSHIQP